MNIFENKVAIITCGASGIGKSICTYLAKKGAQVVVADIDGSKATEVEKALSSPGGKAKGVQIDVSSKDQIQALIENTFNEYGKIDYLFNNAGYGINGEFTDMSLDQWKHIMDVNFWAVVHACYFAYPLMKKQGFGQIINTASLAGLIPGGLLTSYTASKHAVVGFTMSLRAEAKYYGIKINTLCPGYIRTNAQQAGIVVTDYLKAEKNVAMESNMKFLTPDDCINQIMRGVKRNKGIIFSPNRHKIFWLLNKLSPELIPNMFYKIIKKLKKNGGLL